MKLAFAETLTRADKRTVIRISEGGWTPTSAALLAATRLRSTAWRCPVPHSLTFFAADAAVEVAGVVRNSRWWCCSPGSPPGQN
jgi:hypothetical protein